jgi:hypothetical protein
MDYESVATFVGVSVPLMTIAGSAVAFVVKQFSEAKQQRKERFFHLMALIDGPGTIAQKVAAVYQLRDFPEHKDFVVRFCNSQQENVTGEAGASLVDEMKRTAAFMESN